jgi:hypothetical protein
MMEKAGNILARMDAYWDSDRCVVDEYRELETDHLVRLRDANAACLAAMERFSSDEPAYWRWRVEQGMADVGFRRLLSKCQTVSEKLLRCAKIVLAERGVN